MYSLNIKEQINTIKCLEQLLDKEKYKLSELAIRESIHIVESIINKEPIVKYVPLILYHKNLDSDSKSIEITEAISEFEDYVMENQLLSLENIQPEINKLYKLACNIVDYINPEHESGYFDTSKSDKLYYCLDMYDYQFVLLNSLEECFNKE